MCFLVIIAAAANHGDKTLKIFLVLLCFGV